MQKIVDYLKTKNGAYSFIVTGIALPMVTYPLTSLSQLAFLKQVAFAKNGVFYEPTVTDHVLNVFGLFKIPFGVIMAVSAVILLSGIVRLLYLKKIT